MMKFTYSWLQSFFNKKLPSPQELADLLTKHSFETEVKDKYLEVDILHNRASDCLSYIGLAREIATVVDQDVQLPPHQVDHYNDTGTSEVLDLEIKEKELVSCYSLTLIEGVKVQDSSSEIQNKLKQNDIQVINNIVDWANYVMLEWGQPLHAFDLDKIEGDKIIVRQAKEGEEITTLDGEHYVLDEGILVIADEQGPVAIAGIKGGQRAAITSETENAVIESANFDPYSVRQSWRKLGLRTKAAARFEQGLDPNLVEIAQQRMSYLVCEAAAGKVAEEKIDFYPHPRRKQILKLDLDYLNKLLGVKISASDVEDIIHRLHFNIQEKDGNQWTVEVPSYRLDMNISEDLIEEIGRIYGYDNIEPVFPQAALIPPKENFNRFWQRRVKNFLQQAGFSEIYTHAFIGTEDKEKFGLDNKNLVEVANPISKNYGYLTPRLLFNLIKVSIDNRKRFDQVALFEIAKIFRQEDKQQKERWDLSVLLTTKDEHQQDFAVLKGVAEDFLRQSGIVDSWFKKTEAEESWWYPQQLLELKMEEGSLGQLGQISPRLLDKFDFSDSIFVLELNFEKFAQIASAEQEYETISSYPTVTRDLSVIVPNEVLTEQIIRAVSINGGKLLRDVDLVDIYEGEQVNAGKKSLTLRLIYQSPKRALTTEEVNKLQQQVIKGVQQEGWLIRQ